MKTVFLWIIGILLFAFALGACSSTTPIVSEWRNPAYASGSFKRIMIGGLGGENSVRRNFEDEFLAQFRAAGIDALPSYLYMAEDEKLDETTLKQAGQKAGADATIFARPVQVEQKSQIGRSYFPDTLFGISGPHVGVGLHGLGGGAHSYWYNEYTSETTLYDLGKNEVVWTGTIKTTENPRTVVKSYVETVMKALHDKNLIRARE
jgi:hypothetical protein